MSLISQERLLEKLDHCQADQFYNVASIRNFIREEPEAVVRCVDCKSFDPENYYCYTFRSAINPDGFCSRAERKEDG